MDLVNGNIAKTLLKLSIPLVFAMFFQTLYNLVDTVFVGRIGAEAVAAVSIAFPIFFLLIALSNGLSVSTTALIAKHLGAKENKKANNVANNSLVLTIIASLITIVLGLIFLKRIILLLGAEESIADITYGYLKIIIWGSPLLFLNTLGRAILQGEGDTKAAMKFMIVGTLLNIALDPIFIFILNLKVAGAAIATVLSLLMADALLFNHFLRNKSKIQFKNFFLDFGLIKKILVIGLPASVMMLFFSIQTAIFIKIISGYGVFSIAAYGISTRIRGLALLPALGIGSGTIIMVGHNYGANKIYRAKYSIYISCLLSMLFMGLIGILVITFPSYLIAIFNKHPLVLSYGTVMLEIFGLSYAITAARMILVHSFQGFGNSICPLIINIIALIFTVSAAIILNNFYGIIGVWFSVIIGESIAALIGIFWLKIFLKKLC